MHHVLCIGYAKCGTTMLDVVLRESKLVATPKGRKEIKFFVPPQFPADDALAGWNPRLGPWRGCGCGGRMPITASEPGTIGQPSDGSRRGLSTDAQCAGARSRVCGISRWT